MQRVDQRHEHGALVLGREHSQQPLAGTAVALVGAGGQRVHEPVQFDMGVGQLFGVDEVLGQLACQPQHHRGDGGGRLVRVECAGVFGDDAKCQLPQLCLAQQPGIRLNRLGPPRLRGEESVVTEQRAREGVVGADRRGVVCRIDAACNDPGACESGQSGADAAKQLARRLAGERQAEHLTGRRVAVGHQPHHAGSHRLGLTRACTRDHHQRPRRGLDHRRLLVGRCEKSEGRGQLRGTVLRDHGVDVPSDAVCAGQL